MRSELGFVYFLLKMLVKKTVRVCIVLSVNDLV
jgi:hypothetical protein